MSYYRVCSNCGAALDPGEKCDCTNRVGTTSEPRENKEKPPRCWNTETAKVERDLTDLFSTSNDNEK